MIVGQCTVDIAASALKNFKTDIFISTDIFPMRIVITSFGILLSLSTLPIAAGTIAYVLLLTAEVSFAGILSLRQAVIIFFQCSQYFSWPLLRLEIP